MYLLSFVKLVGMPLRPNTLFPFPHICTNYLEGYNKKLVPMGLPVIRCPQEVLAKLELVN